MNIRKLVESKLFEFNPYKDAPSTEQWQELAKLSYKDCPNDLKQYIVDYGSDNNMSKEEVISDWENNKDNIRVDILDDAAADSLFTSSQISRILSKFKSKSVDSNDPSTWFSLDGKTTDPSKLPSTRKVLNTELPEDYLNRVSNKYIKDNYHKFEDRYNQINTLKSMLSDEDLSSKYEIYRKKYSKLSGSERENIINEFSKLLNNSNYNVSKDIIEELFIESPHLYNAVNRRIKRFRSDFIYAKWNAFADLGALPYLHTSHDFMGRPSNWYSWEE